MHLRCNRIETKTQVWTHVALRLLSGLFLKTLSMFPEHPRTIKTLMLVERLRMLLHTSSPIADVLSRVGASHSRSKVFHESQFQVTLGFFGFFKDFDKCSSCSKGSDFERIFGAHIMNCLCGLWTRLDFFYLILHSIRPANEVFLNDMFLEEYPDVDDSREAFHNAVRSTRLGQLNSLYIVVLRPAFFFAMCDAIHVCKIRTYKKIRRWIK